MCSYYKSRNTKWNLLNPVVLEVAISKEDKRRIEAGGLFLSFLRKKKSEEKVSGLGRSFFFHRRSSAGFNRFYFLLYYS